MFAGISTQTAVDVPADAVAPVPIDNADPGGMERLGVHQSGGGSFSDSFPNRKAQETIE